MASWLSHPAYLRTRDRLVTRLRGQLGPSRHLPPIAFICGKKHSDRRDLLADYLQKHVGGVRFFYAEDVWDHIAHLEQLNALEMEEQLARLADLVLVIVESEGTFTELGAFAAVEELRKKLLPVIDRKYESEPSFINTGPVRWVNEDSRFRPAIFGDFEAFLRNVGSIEERISRIPKTGRPSALRAALPIKDKPKELLFLLCEILAITGPAPRAECADILTCVIGSKPRMDVPSLLGLAVTLQLISTTGDPLDPLYVQAEGIKESPAIHSWKLFDLPLERARYISGMQKVPGHWAYSARKGEKEIA